MKAMHQAARPETRFVMNAGLNATRNPARERYAGSLTDIAHRARAFCAELGRIAREPHPSVIGFLDTLVEMERFVSASDFPLEEVMRHDAVLPTPRPDPFPRIATMLRHSLSEWSEASPPPFIVSVNDKALVIHWENLAPVTMSVTERGFLVRSGPVAQMVSPIDGALEAASACSRGIIYGHPNALSLWQRSPEYLASFLSPGTGHLPIIMHGRLMQKIGAWMAQAKRHVDPAIMHTLEMIQSTGMRIPPILLEDAAFWRDPWIQKDLRTYRAARIAAAFVDELAPGENPANALRNWQGMFSRDGIASRSLRRTLINHHHSVPAKTVARLYSIPVDRPLLGRWDLAVRVWGRTVQGSHPCGPTDRLVDELPINLPVLENASDMELAQCFEDLDVLGIMTHKNRYGDRRRSQVRYLLDYPDCYHGTAAGLVRRSILWHQGFQGDLEMGHRSASQDLPCQVFPLPAWPLPKDCRIRHLATSDDLIKESLTMRHCIASYRGKALRGHAFYFHVGHEKGKASIEVDRYGNVLQVCGPDNSTNPACIWAREHFAVWTQPHAGNTGAGVNLLKTAIVS